MSMLQKRYVRRWGAVAVMLLLAACNNTQKLARQAAAGDAAAQFAYSCYLLDARPSPPNALPTAAHLLKQSTLAGHRNAPALLGILYTTGRAWPQNLVLARRYLTIASDRDHSKAQLMLALLYAKGLGTPENPAKAVEHIRYAAMLGSPGAALLMFFCFYDGYGVPHSLPLAIGWLENAAHFGSPEAQYLLNLSQNNPKFSKETDFLRKKLDFFPQK